MRRKPNECNSAGLFVNKAAKRRKYSKNQRVINCVERSTVARRLVVR
jgi:hypothetical protein